MYKKSVLAVALGGLVFTACNPQAGEKELVLASQGDTLSYAIGIGLAKNLETNEIEALNADAIAQAIKDNESDSLRIDEDEANRIVSEYFQQKAEEQRANARAESAGVRQAGEAFLQQNAQNPDVKVTGTGLQYLVMQEGSGALPTETDRVVVHYHGTLIDGTVFDSSVERGEPASFPVNRVIPGWTEALQMMPVGSKWKLFIPADLAYGDNPAGTIPAGSTLIFEVELIDIMK